MVPAEKFDAENSKRLHSSPVWSSPVWFSHLEATSDIVCCNPPSTTSVLNNITITTTTTYSTPLSQSIMLITDQEALSRLALSLSVDIEILLDTIRSNPDVLDEAVRSHFLQAIFSFLRHATDLPEETVRNNPLFGGTTFAAAPPGRYYGMSPPGFIPLVSGDRPD